MKTPIRIGLLLLVLAVAPAIGVPISRAQPQPGTFEQIASVLQSPRCMNCHPAGDTPLQTDESRPHAMNIKRVFAELGGKCTTCHQETSVPGTNLPPAAPHWSMPPAATPMIFQGKSTRALCNDLKDPSKNGNRSLTDLVDHVDHDPLVLWAFNPGDRTPPPMTHAEFVALMADWVAQGAPCPN